MKQIAGENALQIQGENIYVGMSYTDVKDLCTTLIQSELASYTQTANAEAQKRFDSIMEKLLDALKKIDEKYRGRFQEPSIQFAVNETFKEYIRSGNDELSDDLIDLMIERLHVDDHTTKQSLIDEARVVLPKLSSASVAILAVITFVKLSFTNKKEYFIDIIRKMSPVIKQVGNPQSLDIAHLEQVRCGQSLSFVSASQEFVETMQKAYSPMFTHPIKFDDFNRIVNDKGWGHGAEPILLTLLSLFDINGNLMSYNRTTLNDNIFVARKQELLEAANSVLGMAKKYTDEEVKSFFLDIDENWENVFNLFYRPDVKSFIVSPVGYYIGSRKLTKILNEEIPIDLFYS